MVPAMGSHGGATAEGQIEVLHGYGITPEAVGAEIRATMEVEQIGTLEGEDAGEYAGQPVYCERNALAADAILLINRIKAHTDFSGELESGIGKMSVIGLGKRHGAESVHRYGARGLRDLIPRLARYNASHLPLLGGIALIENELGHTSELHALPPDEIGQEGEKNLLRRARAIAPRLPFDEMDVLIIDEMGKNISGAGMDTHVIGRGNHAQHPGTNVGRAGYPHHCRPGPDRRLARQRHGLRPGRHGDAQTDRKNGFRRQLHQYANQRRGRHPARPPAADPADGRRLRSHRLSPAAAKPTRAASASPASATRPTPNFWKSPPPCSTEARSNPRLRVSDKSHPLDLCQAVRPY